MTGSEKYIVVAFTKRHGSMFPRERYFLNVRDVPLNIQTPSRPYWWETDISRATKFNTYEDALRSQYDTRVERERLMIITEAQAVARDIRGDWND